jgi:hypothetical protein
VSQPQDQTIDFAALVKMITESVLTSLQASSRPDGSAGVAPSMPDRPSALEIEARRITWILAAPCGHLELLCREMAVLARLGHQQVVVACPDVVDALRTTPLWPGEGAGLSLRVVNPDGHGVSALLADLPDQELVYVGSLGWHQAAALAALDDRDGFVQLLLGALAARKPVSLVAAEVLDGLQGLAPGSQTLAGPAGVSPVLERQAGVLWRSLEALGVKPLALAELRRPLAALEAAASAQGRALGGLLTERDVEEAASAGLRELRISRGTMITPLARDRARELDVRIEQV